MATVLLVDDRPENLIALKAILEPLGVATVTAGSGTEALRYVLTREFAVIMLDVQMPGMSGYDIARQIKAREFTRHTPIIFLTAMDRDERHVFDGYSVGAVDYMFKPLEPAIVRSKVGVFIELFRRGKQIEHQALLLHEAERYALEQRHTTQLEDSDARLHSVVASAGEAIITFDDTGGIELFNSAAERIFGRQAHQARAVPIFDLIHEDAHDMFRLALHEAQPTHALAETDTPDRARLLRGVRPDGTTFNLEGVISCVPLRSGALYTLIAHDITARERAEQLLTETRDQLYQAQKLEALGRLAGGIAHDFNNILTVIQTCSDLLRYETASPTALVDINEISHATARAADLTRQLLTFSKKQMLHTQSLDINDIISSIEMMLRRLMPENIEITTTLQPSLWTVLADKGQIEQIIMNLSVNARDAMPEGGRLSISTRNVELSKEQADAHEGVAPGSHVMLTVTDTGVGMNQETQYHVFEPFFTTKPPGSGTGLGLATVYGIVQQARGYIWLYSEPAHGTTFKIFFPRSAEHPVAVQEHTDSVSLEGSESILLIEDDTSIRSLAARILTSHGYRVTTANSGEAALRKFLESKVQPDLVITDIVLPGMNGRDTAVRLRDFAPNLKSMYMSGYTDDEIVRRGLVQEKAVFLSKPFSAEALLRKTREALDFLP